MRLWSLHPYYLDATGLVALWRETLLARAVLMGQTKGYTHHPQLVRFREAEQPDKAIEVYLQHILVEAKRRGYRFDSSKVSCSVTHAKLPITKGQIAYEWSHLMEKLARRSYPQYVMVKDTDQVLTHPLFYTLEGDISQWEKVIK